MYQEQKELSRWNNNDACIVSEGLSFGEKGEKLKI